jgi:ketosteroid isomerase-like protein
MSEHPNVARMRAGYEAFGKGDLDTLREQWAPDIVWHETGHTELAGTYRGVDAVFGYFGRLLELTEGSLRVEPRAFLADDTYGATPVTVTAHRGDRHLEVLNVHLVRFVDGLVVEFWDTTTNEDTMDEFFG